MTWTHPPEHRHDQGKKVQSHYLYHHDTILTKEELKKFKEKFESEATKEIMKLHFLEAFEPVGARKITKKQRAEAVV